SSTHPLSPRNLSTSLMLAQKSCESRSYFLVPFSPLASLFKIEGQRISPEIGLRGLRRQRRNYEPNIEPEDSWLLRHGQTACILRTIARNHKYSRWNVPASWRRSTTSLACTKTQVHVPRWLTISPLCFTGTGVPSSGSNGGTSQR